MANAENGKQVSIIKYQIKSLVSSHKALIALEKLIGVLKF